MKALITGVTGFVGGYLSRRLLNEGYEVTGIARSGNSQLVGAVNFIDCDITNEARLRDILKTEKPDEIFHLAGSAFVPSTYKNPKGTYNTILNGTLALYEAIRELELSAKVLYVGSAAVYGEGDGVPFVESDLLQPNNPYAGAKACADLLSEQYFKSYNMNIIRVRPFNHTGPGQSPAFVCSSFAKQIVEAEMGMSTVLNTGNIHVKRDFLDVRDVVEAYCLLMKKGQGGEVYNISSQSAVSVSDLLDMLSSKSRLNSINVEINPNKLRPNEVMVKIGDNSKIRRMIGWKPVWDLEHTMIDLLDYWRNCLK